MINTLNLVSEIVLWLLGLGLVLVIADIGLNGRLSWFLFQLFVELAPRKNKPADADTWKFDSGRRKFESDGRFRPSKDHESP